MFKYHCLNAISEVGLREFTGDYNKVEDINEAESILVRSAAMHDMQFGKELRAIARAGAGVNNIPLDRCAEEGIVVFNTPGANANAVKELVLMGMLMAYRHGFEAASWVKENKADADIATTTEKAKKAYGGNEIFGKTIGIIGMGAIGMKIAQSCMALGMDVVGYDAFPIPEARLALIPGAKIVNTMEEVYTNCDFLTIHVPLNDSTKGMINAATIAKMRDGVVVMNFARGGLINNADMAAALKEGKVRSYVCDFPDAEVANMEGALVLPHLGASTDEAEENCAAMAVKQVREFFENGNIVNSVNYPNVSLDRAGKNRICILFKGESILDKVNVNVKASKEAVKGAFGYAIIDTDDDACPCCIKTDDMLRVTVING